MVTAVAADEFEHVGVAAFGPALHDADRLAPQDNRPPQRGLITGSHGYLHGAPSEPVPTGLPSSGLLGNVGHVIDYVADALAVSHPSRVRLGLRLMRHSWRLALVIRAVASAGRVSPIATEARSRAPARFAALVLVLAEVAPLEGPGQVDMAALPRQAVENGARIFPVADCWIA